MRACHQDTWKKNQRVVPPLPRAKSTWRTVFAAVATAPPWEVSGSGYVHIYIYVYMRVCRRMGPYIRTTSMELYMGSVTGRSTASVRVDDIIARIDRLMEASGMLEHIHILHVRALHIRMDEADAWCRCAWIHPSHRS